MRLLVIILGLAGLLPSAPASATPPPPAPGSQPLRPISTCIDPSRVRGYSVLDSRRLLIDAGRRRYLVTLAWSCTELHGYRALAFDTRNPSGRVCGDIGDAVLPREGRGGVLGRCDIGRVEAISIEDWEAELRAR